MVLTHLQVRSGYSLLDSTITLDAYVNHAKQLQVRTLALTDEAVLYGVIPFYKACVQAGIKPIIGMVVNVEQADATFACTLLAKNNAGYKQLMAISTAIQTKEALTFDLLARHAADVLCMVPIEGTLKQALMDEARDEGIETLELFSATFASMYVGISDAVLPMGIVELLREKSFDLVALQDVRYLKAEDAASFACLQAMKRDEHWSPNEIVEQAFSQHFQTEMEMAEAFADYPALLTNTTVIADQCQVTFDFEQHLLPAFPVPTEEDAHTYLSRISQEKMRALYAEITPRMESRLAYELGVIRELGFSDYFLIVADFVQFAKDNAILVGPGRGSAAGAFVAYLLGITAVDPLQYDLLFERFLNPERVTMPDIDIDFSDVRRDEVIAYVREKYGQDHVAQIITFGTYGVRSLLRELMKTMDIDRHDQAYILQQIPQQATGSIASYVRASEGFADYIKQSPSLRALFTIAVKLEGLPRHTSTHAAGIVIGKEQLLENVPLTFGAQDTYLTQYAMDELEAIGLLKIDILGLRNLSFLERILDSIKRNKKKTIRLQDIPLDDEKTFALLQKGSTNGIFQLESAGMKRVLMQLRPTVFEDIVALNALYRPGPMENIPAYIERKHGNKGFTYSHPDLASILDATYGVLVYQEQIMQIAHRFAGFSLGQADILRRAVSKKELALMEEEHLAFVQGCMRQGYSEAVGEEIFSWIVKFADYGFNKSHSVAYSMIGYQLSYLKAHYPTEFFAQLFGTISSDPQKMTMYVREAMELGIALLPPSINKSYAAYSIEADGVRMGLRSIKGIGYETVKEILELRKVGPFKDLFDFCLRTKKVKRNALETLIIAGAFDETYDNRASLLASIDQAFARAELFGDMHGQGNLFAASGKMRPAYIEMEDFSQLKKLADEKELLDMYVSSHPLKQFRPVLREKGYLRLAEVLKYNNNQVVKTAVFVQQMRQIKTKRGDSMAFITVADEGAEIEGVVFPSLFREVRRILREEAMVYIEGKVSIRQDKKQLVADKIRLMDTESLGRQSNQKVYIRVRDVGHEDALAYLRKTAGEFPGRTNVLVFNEAEKKTYQLAKSYALAATETCMLNLMGYFGAKNVVLKS